MHIREDWKARAAQVTAVVNDHNSPSSITSAAVSDRLSPLSHLNLSLGVNSGNCQQWQPRRCLSQCCLSPELLAMLGPTVSPSSSMPDTSI